MEKQPNNSFPRGEVKEGGLSGQETGAGTHGQNKGEGDQIGLELYESGKNQIAEGA